MITKKEKFQGFLERIYLDGELDRILILANEEVTFCQAYIEEKVFGVQVTLNENIFNLSEKEIAISNLDSLFKIVKSMPEDVDILLKKNENNLNDNRLHKILLSNDMITTSFILGKKSIIRNHKKFINLEKLEAWLFTYDFSNFIDEFNKYENVLKDYDTFFFSCTDTVHINFGGLQTNIENVISIDLKIKPDIPFSNTILFDKNLFKSILKTNKDSDIKLHVNDTLYYVECTNDIFDVKYFNTKTKNQ